MCPTAIFIHRRFIKCILLLLLTKTVTPQFYTFPQCTFFDYYIEQNFTVSNFTEAQLQCQSKEALLVVINTREINNFLVEKIENLTASSSYYIGLTRISNGSEFRWIDGTLLSSGYSEWSNESNGSSAYGDCVALSQSNNASKWKVVPCNSPSRFICQKVATAEINANSPANESVTTERVTIPKTDISSTSTASTASIYFYLTLGLGGLQFFWILLVICLCCFKKRPQRANLQKVHSSVAQTSYSNHSIDRQEAGQSKAGCTDYQQPLPKEFQAYDDVVVKYNNQPTSDGSSFVAMEGNVGNVNLYDAVAPS